MGTRAPHRPPRRARTAITAAIAVVATFAALAVGPAASGDYAPYIVADKTTARPGESVTFGNDASGQCPYQGPDHTQPSDGRVEWALGSIAGDPSIGGVVELDEVLVSGTVTAADGDWSVTVIVPAGTPPGTYVLAGRCFGVNPPEPGAEPSGRQAAPLLFDYFPARLTVGAPATTTTTTVAVTAEPEATPPAPPAAAPVAAAPTFTG